MPGAPPNNAEFISPMTTNETGPLASASNQARNRVPADLILSNLKLASPPELYMRLSEFLDDPTKNLKEASLLIEHDPSFAARLLKIVNSPLYGFASAITSIQQAVSIIGLDELRDLALSTLLAERFPTSTGHGLNLRAFWTNSVRCALFARGLAKHHADSRVLKAVFVSGLMHEIGQLVLCRQLPEEVARIKRRAVDESQDEVAIERQELGFDRYDVGAELVKHWRLPDVLALTIKSHHAPQAAPLHSQECSLVVLAQQLALSQDPSVTLPLFSTLDLDPALTEPISTVVDQQFDSIFAMIFRS